MNQVQVILPKNTNESYRRSFLEFAAAEKGLELTGEVSVSEPPVPDSVREKFSGFEMFTADCEEAT